MAEKRPVWRVRVEGLGIDERVEATTQTSALLAVLEKAHRAGGGFDPAEYVAVPANYVTKAD